MRVKLSYTANVEDILAECAYLVSNKSDTLQEVMVLFSGVIASLKSTDANPNQIFESIASLRQNLAQLDTRLVEVEQIVEGHHDYQRLQRNPPETIDSENSLQQTKEEDLDD